MKRSFGKLLRPCWPLSLSPALPWPLTLMRPRLGGAVVVLALQAAVVVVLALQAPLAAPPGRMRRSTTPGLIPVPTMSAALALITSTLTAT